MKKHYWVIITIILAAATIITIRLIGPSEPTHSFSGTFIITTPQNPDLF